MATLIHAEPEEDLAVIVRGRTEGPAPDWLHQAVRFQGFLCATQTADTISVIVAESFLNKVDILDCHVETKRWASFRSKADAFPEICEALEAAKVDANVVSMSTCEYFLLPSEQLSSAAVALLERGHAICPSRRLCPPREVQSRPECRRFAGAWLLQEDEGNSFRLQGACGLYIDIRPASGLKEASSAGRLDLPRGRRHRIISLQPPAFEVSIQLSEEGSECVHEDIQIRSDGLCLRSFRETWRCSAAKLAVVLRLDGEPSRSDHREGYWIFAGGRFARLIGFSQGQGLIDGCCCSSLSQLENLFGERVLKELENYEVTSGFADKPGSFRANYQAPGERLGRDEFAFDAQKGIGGRIELTTAGGEVIKVVHHRPSGTQHWKVLEWGFDPFTAEDDDDSLAKLEKAKRKVPDEGQGVAKKPRDEASRDTRDSLPIKDTLDADAGLAKANGPRHFPGNFPVGYPPPPDEVQVTEEEKAKVISAVATAAMTGALPPGTTQAIVLPSKIGSPVVLSTYKTDLEGMTPKQIADALSEEVLPWRSSLPPATALVAAAAAAAASAAASTASGTFVASPLPLTGGNMFPVQPSVQLPRVQAIAPMGSSTASWRSR